MNTVKEQAPPLGLGGNINGINNSNSNNNNIPINTNLQYVQPSNIIEEEEFEHNYQQSNNVFTGTLKGTGDLNERESKKDKVPYGESNMQDQVSPIKHKFREVNMKKSEECVPSLKEEEDNNSKFRKKFSSGMKHEKKKSEVEHSEIDHSVATKLKADFAEFDINGHSRTGRETERKASSVGENESKNHKGRLLMQNSNELLSDQSENSINKHNQLKTSNKS
eukprot:CAMPEP_0170523660 /NCGR_PEP_ID=MMETSP0209-20121228/9077_1 /TAXON_ID=665100 ORGANISM="Litonotus pictus, Strain P1" /NCGR_SAMPLE_ID=MMETSP0209 /ASSEMBLY_ACC=CAM_ASM_000301 /LENGTH=221 /DNA_ID=CAMNT_0010811867 /DNA_START=114 /DNA_END=776 /DNA_ORIENTATION=+